MNKYWSFSSGVDCVLPEGVTAYIAIWDAEQETPRIAPLEEEQLKLKDGRRGIKANNGVLIAGEKDNTYEIVASPGNQKSGTKPATEDADSYYQLRGWQVPNSEGQHIPHHQEQRFEGEGM